MKLGWIVLIATMVTGGVAVETAHAKQRVRLPALMLASKPAPKPTPKDPKKIKRQQPKRQRSQRTRSRTSARRNKDKRKSKRHRRRRRDLWPPMKLEHINNKEKLTVRLYDRNGRSMRASVRRIERLMRCHHTGRRRRLHWRLVRNLYKISRRFKGRTIKIVSGYRHRRVARSRTSNHVKGRAMDFYVAGVSKRVLRDYLRSTFKKCGVGYYPNSFFVHFDIRDKRAFWVDLSGTGEDPKYVKNAYTYLEKEKGRKRSKRIEEKKTEKIKTDKTLASRAKQQEPTVMDDAAKPRQPQKKSVEVTGPPEKKVEVAGPPPVGPAPVEEAGNKKRSQPPSDGDSTRASQEEKPQEKPQEPAPTKEKGGPVSNVRGAP